MLVLLCLSLQTVSARTLLQLDQNCTVSILNRTIQANEHGRFAMPNVPSFMGQIRARATCVNNGLTTSAQTDYFTIVNNDTIDTGDFYTSEEASIPTALNFIGGTSASIFGAGNTLQLIVTASFADGSGSDVSAATSGINYTASNRQVISVDADGLVTSVATGTSLVTARKDGVIAVLELTVTNSGDSDGDGLPDVYELANGLDPQDPIDALEDQDRDGLSAIDEYGLGTDINNADTDSDGILDGEEVIAGDDGFITNPLLADTDGDGISDGLEILSGSDPTDEASGNLADSVVSIEVSPASLLIVFDTIRSESSAQLTVTGHLIDGSEIDITSRSGINYLSSDLSIVSFGADPGQFFAGQAGSATVTVSYGAIETTVSVTVESYTPAPVSVIDLPTFGNNVDIDGDYAFVAGGQGGLYVIDTADKTVPFIAATLGLSGNANDIKVRSGFAYIAAGDSGLHIVDVSNPLQPTRVSTVDTPGNAIDLVLSDSHVYLADGRAGLQIINIQDITAPFISGGIVTGGEANGLDHDGDIVVVSNFDQPLAVLDVANPQSPMLLSTLNVADKSYDVQLRLPYAYIGSSDSLKVVDLTNPELPVFGGTFGNRIWMTDLEFGPDDLLFTNHIQPSTPMQIIDISAPATPGYVGQITYSSLGAGVTI